MKNSIRETIKIVWQNIKDEIGNSLKKGKSVWDNALRKRQKKKVKRSNVINKNIYQKNIIHSISRIIIISV